LTAFDLTAFRIVVKELKDCYEALGVIHNKWKPIPGRFRDYIGMPKANMYQSLHTSVVGPMGQRMEVQIRTEEMHRVAEEGIAAHWRYKERAAAPTRSSRPLCLAACGYWNGCATLEDPSEFMQSLRMDLYPDEIFVFTPGGEVKELPRGATPVDFAYTIHTEVGHTCVGAKVNGRMVPLRSQAQHRRPGGDRHPKANHTPSKDWLNFVVTSRARSKINALYPRTERSPGRGAGPGPLDREFRKHNLTLAATIREGKLDSVVRYWNLSPSRTRPSLGRGGLWQDIPPAGGEPEVPGCKR
jgi:guanosine-3',5'-bis(diphosphate) 3'-pyrophosphohydrolase